MVSCRYGGASGQVLDLHDSGDLVVVRSRRRGSRHDLSPLAISSREALSACVPLFGFPSAGVGVYAAPPDSSRELASEISADPEVQFAGRGLRDEFGAPVVYTENVFIKFFDGVSQADADEILRPYGLSVHRPISYSEGSYFVRAEEGMGVAVFDAANDLLDRADVDLCHPELVREVSRRAFTEQWHLWTTDINGQTIDAHAHVVEAWNDTQGDGATICVIDDGVDIDHEEFASGGKIAHPQSMTHPRGGDPRPGDGDNHGTACSGVACADGKHGASGVAPKAKLMPVRLVSGLGSQDEADAMVWAADHGADVISCSWGPVDGEWWNPQDPTHHQVVPLPDSSRLAIDYAVTNGRSGRGCVITWAAGNGAESVDNDGYASYEKVIAVAACNDHGVRSAYSDFGDAIWCSFPSSHGLPSVTPGIWTTDRSGNAGYNPGQPALGDQAGNYVNSFGGTSSACPGVAGVVALLLSVNPELTSAQVKEVLRANCDRIDDQAGEYDANGHSRNYGYGRINAASVVAAGIAGA